MAIATLERGGVVDHREQVGFAGWRRRDVA